MKKISDTTPFDMENLSPEEQKGLLGNYALELTDPNLIRELFAQFRSGYLQAERERQGFGWSGNRSPDKVPIVLDQDTADKVRYGLVRNPNLPSDVIDGLIQDLDRFYLAKLAQRQDLSPAQFAILVDHGDDEVRRAVADNPSAPPEVLQELIGDVDPEVVRLLLSNANSPQSVWDYYGKVKSDRFRRELAQNKQTPPEHLVRMLDRVKYPRMSEGVFYEIISNPNFPEEKLLEMKQQVEGDEEANWMVDTALRRKRERMQKQIENAIADRGQQQPPAV